MNLFTEAIDWIFSAERFQGYNPLGLRLGEHLWFTFLSLLLAAAIAIPLGYLIGHTGKGRNLAVGISGAARALPSFGLIVLLVLIVGVTRAPAAAVISFVLLAIPSILAGAYSGLEAIDRRVIDSARAMGMTEWQILWKVEIPLGLPLLIGGLRSGALQIVATATLAAYIGLGGLGIYIFEGLPLRDYPQMLGSAILIAALALLLDALFAILQQFVVPRGVTAGRVRDDRATSTRRRAVAGTPAE